MTRHAGAWRHWEHLALRPAICHSVNMNGRRSSAAGGIFLFLGPVIGAIVGVGRGEPILWMLGGFAVGLLLALLMWIVQRRR